MVAVDELTKNERITCLSCYGGEGRDFGMGIDESLYSHHYALNKPVTVKNGEPSSNKVIQDKFPNSLELALEAGLLPMGVMGLNLTTDGHFLLGYRRRGATLSIGDIALVPAGFCALGKPGSDDDYVIYNTAKREFLEEVLKIKEADGLPQQEVDMTAQRYIADISLVGLTYVDQATNRGFGIPVIIQSKLDSRELGKVVNETNPDPEHIGYFVWQLTPDSVTDLVKQKGSLLEIHTLGTILCGVVNQFNAQEWYNRMVSEVIPSNWGGRVLTLPENTFDERRTVVEVIRETMPQRYPS